MTVEQRRTDLRFRRRSGAHGSLIERNGIDVLSVAGPRGVYSFPLRILRQYWGDRNVPEDMAEYYLHSKKRAFSVCGQIVASRIIILVGIKYPIIQAPWAGAAKADLAASVSEVGGLGSLN